MPPVRLQLLGQTRLVCGEKVIERFRYQKAVLLLAYLALHPGEHSREGLAERLWPDCMPEEERRHNGDPKTQKNEHDDEDRNPQRSNLRQALYHLRQDLAPLAEPPCANGDAPLEWLLCVRRDTLGIRSDNLTTDVGDFCDCVKRAERAPSLDQRITLYQQAIQRYGGEFLPGIHKSVFPDETLEHWAYSEGVDLAKRYENARRTLEQLLAESSHGTDHRDTDRVGNPIPVKPPDYSALSEPERRCLGALTLFPGGCTPKQANRVLGMPRAAQCMEALTGKGWVRCEGEGNTRRFYLPEGAREAAKLPLRELRSLQARLLRYHRERLYEWDRKYLNNNRPLPDEVRKETINLFASFDACFEEPKLLRLGIRLASHIYSLHNFYPADRDALSDVERVLAHWSHIPERMRWQMLMTGGHLALARGKIGQAKRYFQQAAGYERANHSSDYPLHLVDALCLFALCCHHLEEDAEAIRSLEEALKLQSETRARPDLVAGTLTHYATAFQVQGRVEEARSALEEALPLLTEKEPNSLRAWSLYQYGCLLHHMGEFTRAAQSLNESWLLRERMGDSTGQAECLRTLALLRAHQGALAEARNLLKMALTVEPESGNPMGRVATRGLLGWVAFLEGSLPEAEAALTESLRRWREEGHQRWQGILTTRLAAVALVQGNGRQARSLCLEAIRLSPGTRALLTKASALCIQGRAAICRRSWAEAERCLNDSLSIHQKVVHPIGVAECLEEMGLLARLLGRESESERWEAEALALREAIGAPVPSVWRAWRDRVLCRHARKSERY
jgi:tetratricopeptide (TPR) repeat protein